MKLHRVMFALIMLGMGFALVVLIARGQWGELPILAGIGVVAFGVALWNESKLGD